MAEERLNVVQSGWVDGGEVWGSVSTGVGLIEAGLRVARSRRIAGVVHPHDYIASVPVSWECNRIIIDDDVAGDSAHACSSSREARTLNTSMAIMMMDRIMIYGCFNQCLAPQRACKVRYSSAIVRHSVIRTWSRRLINGLCQPSCKGSYIWSSDSDFSWCTIMSHSQATLARRFMLGIVTRSDSDEDSVDETDKSETLSSSSQRKPDAPRSASLIFQFIPCRR